MITPYLKKFNTEGGTLYVFPSVSNDLTRTFVSNDYEFKFSHFACLNIPDLYSGKYSDGSDDEQPKGLYIETLMDRSLARWTSNTMCNAITENIQNYVMNFETAILNGEGDDDSYDADILTTVSEKVFWNWMQKVGAIKFTESGNEEEYMSYADRTVQYIGNIEVMNTVEVNGDTFEEIYMHIPSEVGASTSVYFRTGELTDNKNYLDKNYTVSNEVDGESCPEYIIGRNADSVAKHEAIEGYRGISIKSIMDIDNGGNVYSGDVGHTIDFRDSSYSETDGISDMNSSSLEDFEFNAILIYYDIYQKTSTPNVKRVATNLYGILFLDQVTDLTGDVAIDDESNGISFVEGKEGYIQRYPKKKETLYGNGNSYALKLDLKIDTTGDTSSSYIELPDLEHTAAMTIYVEALEQLQRCVDIFTTQKDEIAKLRQRVETLENLTMGIDSISSLQGEIDRLYDICNGNGLVNTATLLGLIDQNTKKLDNIMNGGKDLKLQYDTDVIQPGPGIGIQKSLNRVVISSEQKYSINTVYEGDGSDGIEINTENRIKTSAASKLCTIMLRPGENFAVIYFTNDGNSPAHMNINVNDDDYNWEVGQSLKIHFLCDNGSLLFDDDISYGVIIKPDTENTISISGADFEGHNNIEVVCVGEDLNGSKQFIYLMK